MLRRPLPSAARNSESLFSMSSMAKPGRSAATVELDHPEHRLGALVRMANQIARQWAADPNADPVASTVTHMQNFWEQEMRVDLARAVDTGSVTVDDLVVEAVRRLTVHA